MFKEHLTLTLEARRVRVRRARRMRIQSPARPQNAKRFEYFFATLAAAVCVPGFVNISLLLSRVNATSLPVGNNHEEG